MKREFITLQCLAVLSGLLTINAPAESVIFEIGAFDNTQGDFEQESDAFNDPRFYTEAGDYSDTQGVSGFGMEVEGPEILQDGPTNAEWPLSTEGFPRALVPGRGVLDIFFQLTAQEAQSPALRLNTLLFQPGADSSHDVTIYLNNRPLWRKPFIQGNTEVSIELPKTFPGVHFYEDGNNYHEGPNVLSFVRTGGGTVNPWIQFDAVALTAIDTATPSNLIFQVGRMDMNQADFEQESGAFNDPAFHYEPGNYSEIQGRAGFGQEVDTAEIWQDGPTDGEWGMTMDGFPRAMVPGRGVIDVFFQMTAQEAASDFLHFQTDLIGQGGNSSHDVLFYLNDTLVAQVPDVRVNTPVDLYIPRAGLLGAGIGAPFQTGGNVFSAVRSTGGPVDPEGDNQPWIQFDHLTLSTAAEAPEEVSVPKVILDIGVFNESTAEFEQEGGAFNNPQFYAHGGNYTEVEGRAGFGEDHPEPEIWQDDADSGRWADTMEGFPRAMVPGFSVIDIFFQLDEATLANTDSLHFSTRAFGLGGNSSHDLEFFINGKSFLERPEIIGAVDFSVILPKEDNFVAGPNVLSFVRTGGGKVDPEGDDQPWIQFDAVSLKTTLTLPAIPVPPVQTDFRVSTVNRDAATGAVTLSWESVTGATYTVLATDNPAGTWNALTEAQNLPGTGQAMQHTDSTVPAGAQRRFYRVQRNQPGQQ